MIFKKFPKLLLHEGFFNFLFLKKISFLYMDKGYMGSIAIVVQ
jgi:hypothetical protein